MTKGIITLRIMTESIAGFRQKLQHNDTVITTINIKLLNYL